MTSFFFFFNDTATTEIYTLSLHDALPISVRHARSARLGRQRGGARPVPAVGVLHGLPVPLGGRGGGDVRPDAHAALAARAARVTATRPIDLRSDTVTRPSPAMRRAMAEAEVGDDVLDGDPTTRRLEQRIAELLGKDDALFFPSGTQANQAGIALLTRPGTELVLEANAHLVHYELAGVAANWGVQIRPVTTPDGLLTGDLVRGALRPASPHVPRAGAVAVENTHNAAGGKVMPAAVMAGNVAGAGAGGVRGHPGRAPAWDARPPPRGPPPPPPPGAGTPVGVFSEGLGGPL